MKGLLKNLGLILVLVGAVILVACSFTGNVNNNTHFRYFSCFDGTGIDYIHYHQ